MDCNCLTWLETIFAFLFFPSACAIGMALVSKKCPHCGKEAVAKLLERRRR